MSATFLRDPLLSAWEVEHGFGLRDGPEPPGLARPRQVHGCRVLRAEAGAFPEAQEADAVWTSETGRCVGVVTADCVPILIACDGGSRVAALHAGWRGLAAGVVEAGVTALRNAGARHWRAAVGPHIGMCCYEVDEPVLASLRARLGQYLDDATSPSRPGHANLDLGALACAALRACDVPADAIGVATVACTRCDPRRFHSYRRDGSRAGRLVHFVRARSGGLDTSASPA